MKRPTVAITGLGMMTGLGLDADSSFAGLVAGESPAREFTLFEPQGLTTRFGVELPSGAEELFKAHLKPRQRRQMTRGTQIACVTAQMAWVDAGLDDAGLDPERVGVVVGATGTGYAPTTTDPDRHRILKNMASAPAAWISLKGKFEGPSMVISTACSSGAFALHAAAMLITSGECDIVVCGAGDSSLNYLDVDGFAALMALAQHTDDPAQASKPFDLERSGFVIGEGGGMMVVEALDSARARGAHCYAQMALPGLCSEAYNIISPKPEGTSIARSMQLALTNAGLTAADIDYINAHGTSTPLNDLYETQAIKTVFGDHTRGIPVSSTKSMTGHCLSAAASIEAVICCKALEQGIIPPTINLNHPDPELDLDFVPHRARQKQLTHVMSNAFAFGGQNGVCIFSKSA